MIDNNKFFFDLNQIARLVIFLDGLFQLTFNAFVDN